HHRRLTPAGPRFGSFAQRGTAPAPGLGPERTRQPNMRNKSNPPNLGAVVSVRGSVVDARFEQLLPPINSMLRAGAEGKIMIEVLAQLDAHSVRGIALTPTQGLARGMQVEDTGGPL